MPLGIDFTQIFLHMINVVILFAGLYLIVYAPVKSFMAKREEYYKDMDKQASDKLADAEKKQEEYQNKLDQADEEIAAKKREADAELHKMRSEMEAEARESATKIVEDAKQEAINQRQNIVKGAKKDIAGMIEEAARKVVLTGNTSEAYDLFLDNAERSGE